MTAQIHEAFSGRPTGAPAEPQATERMLKVLKALAESLDMSLGELLEGIVLHAFEGRPPFTEATLAKIARLREVFELDLTADDSHRLEESEGS